jgi:nicotinate-nucleotide pyrophosphorylase (carboxylating)
MLNDLYMDEIIRRVLKEDMPMGDITTDNLIEKDLVSRGHIIAKDRGIIAGLDMAERVFKVLDNSVKFKRLVRDGDKVNRGDIIAEVEGNTRALLKGERTALDFLQRLSGIATKTGEFCEKVREFPVKISDTRKTTPGLRLLEKYAVRIGGGHNHRFSLSDGVLIKDNHIKAAGSIKKAIELSRQKIPHTIKIEVETENLEQVREALECGADIIMLDNMSMDMMKEAVKIIDKKALVEASGNVDLEKVYEIASIGADIISVGGLTHSAKALDMSLKFI